ncbi:AMP-binding protein [Maridesulfovibrio hydrothermalis]|uniref:Acyl-coenzyme A synthetase ACSM3, mitochondrial n=1 Tax=Maridesulfovibrio hydrothermalis AM13 = DSM 14728 TaxID=1121451 RepID=L0RB97_9BACT|nr:AMP-binding protein [Maridesulfovibrio hydrothermalis]CCO22851.1 Acyl-coenzyme A synthetase ACSM3, mitochondrial [Maridesulfovibrio hydrothermalis AM13 = DSM 14728]
MQKQNFKTNEDFYANYKTEVPADFNFAFDVVDKIAAEDPRRTAMIHIGPTGTRVEKDFEFFSTESSRFANGLAAAGIGKGDRIMIILYRRIDWWVAMLACHKVGAVPVPSPNLLTVKDIEFRVNFARIKGIIAEDSVADRAEEARKNCPSLEVLVQAGESDAAAGWLDLETVCAESSDSFPRPADCACGDDSLLIFFSSGTTGPPKMVEHTHNYPLGHYTTGAYWHDLNPGDVHLTLADTGWGKAVWGKYYGQWMAGAVVFVWDFRGKFDPSELLAVLADHKVTSFCAPPTVYRFMIREDLSKYDLSALRHCTTAGELLNASVYEAWKEATGLPLYEGYGQTESVLQIATFPNMTPKPGSIGKPCPGWEIVLIDTEGNLCAAGEEGQICVKLDPRPVGLFTGYLDEPQKTENVMVDGYYQTGDKAWMDEDGYYWFLGRTDDLIKSSGYRIGPFEVESALITHDAIVEAAVTGVPCDVRGQAVKATVVLASGYEAGEELTRELQNHVKKVTAPYKYPRVIDYVAELPKTISGKIKRAEIRARDEADAKA